MEVRNAPTVWPVSVRPERSVIVPEISSGTLRPTFFENLRDGKDCRLGVQGVEDRLDEEQVDATFKQTAHLLFVGASYLIESDGAKTGIVHIRRKRGGNGEWA